MHVAGTFHYDASPETMYALFTDPDALRNATPGLRTLRPIGPDRWEAEMKVGIGGFALLYHGTLTVSDRQPGQGYRISIDAQTHNGGVQAEADLRFQRGTDPGTTVAYEADVDFYGAQKLLPAIARGLVDFFLFGMKEYLRAGGSTPANSGG